MRARRIALTLAMVVAGAVIARTDDVVPLAAKLAAPLLAQRDAAPENTVAPTLPQFVNTPHTLTFPNETESAVEAPAAVAPKTPEETATVAPVEKSDAAVTVAVEAAAAPDMTVPMVTYDPGLTTAGKTKIEVPVGASAATETDISGKVVTKVAKANDDEVAVVGETRIIAAKTLFGAAKSPSLLAPRAIGKYSRGCLAGGVAIPIDGPAWQAMRLSRNRRFGHPKLVDLVQDLAVAAQKEDGWSGLLVGDMSQPRGGPMLTGHASHQIGLDADIWLTPMPKKRLSQKQRESLAATSMLDKTGLAVNGKVFTDKHVKLIKRAASYPEVERVLVHPAIKKALCEAAGTDRAWLGKVRPYYGHFYHMHVRLGCPKESTNCVPQKATTGLDGCDKEIKDWLALLARQKKPEKPDKPKVKPRPKLPVLLTQLPDECRVVLESGSDGVPVPPEAMLAPPTGKHHHKGKPPQKEDVVLKPAKERRAKREAKMH